MNPTDEQEQAIRCFATGQAVKIEAGAGTGKTTTLKLLAESTNRRGQYIAFNKAIVVESGAKMPDNIACNTAHSLAFRHIGHKFKHRLKSERMKSYDIAKILGLKPFVISLDRDTRKVMQASFLAGLTMQSVVRFCQSADEEPTWRHVPYIEGIDDIRDGKRSYVNNNVVAHYIENALKIAWSDLMNPNGRLPFRHDHYLKAWQLDRPRISADFILFDEAQDANPVMVDVVANQAQYGTQLIWVGDSQQQIYSFTGAINALANMPASHTTFLTQSFRFGPPIAEEANRVLDMLEADLRIRGTSSISSVVERVSAPQAVLARTNAAALRTLLAAQEMGRKAHLVGGGKDVVSFARAAERLMNRQPAEHPELSCFDSWNEVCEYVSQDEQGAELRLMVSLVNDFGTGPIISALGNMVPEERASLIVSTAHKAKGREWGSVKLAKDFPSEAKGKEELRLLYVAVTRARNTLDISDIELLTRKPDRLQDEVIG